jgi:hypothetical protein
MAEQIWLQNNNLTVFAMVTYSRNFFITTQTIVLTNWIANFPIDYCALPSSAGGLYSGGSAQMVENSLGIHGDEILYVGDHIYTDVSQSKVHLRWRTALICRELEDEVSIIGSHWPHLE